MAKVTRRYGWIKTDGRYGHVWTSPCGSWRTCGESAGQWILCHDDGRQYLALKGMKAATEFAARLDAKALAEAGPERIEVPGGYLSKEVREGEHVVYECFTNTNDCYLGTIKDRRRAEQEVERCEARETARNAN